MENLFALKVISVLVLGLSAQWIAWRLRLPAIVLLAAFGLLVGPVFGFLHPAEDFGPSFETAVKLALAYVLFEGGLQLKLFELRRASQIVYRLCSIGLLATWLLGTAAAILIGGLSVPTAVVSAGILVVTGPTVILPLLRQTRLSSSAGNVGSLLKWEGIVNDPLGALVAVLSFEYFVFRETHLAAPWGDVLWSLGAALGVSILLAWVATKALHLSFERGLLPEFLKVPVVIGAVISIYVLANVTQAEAGLLAVTLFGFLLGTKDLFIIEEIRRFKEHIAVVIVSVIFILLTANLNRDSLSLLWTLQVGGVVLAYVLLVRPVAVLLSTIGTETTWRERALMSVVAPRGIVAAGMAGLFAPEMLEGGIADAGMILPVVFGVIFITILISGFAAEPLARVLRLGGTSGSGLLIVGASPWSTELARVLHDSGLTVVMADSSWHRLKEARSAGIKTFYGEILSHVGEEELDWSEVSDILIATENDAYNALVATRLTPKLGESHVFQLAPHVPASDSRQISRGQLGRIAFRENALLERLLVRYYQGWKFHRTKITESYGMKDHQRDTPGEQIEILILRDGELQMNSVNRPVEPEVGDILVSFRPGESQGSRKGGVQAA